MNVRSCILCLSPGTSAAPGWHACHRCADRLAGMLGDLGDRYATLMEADELIPHGTGERGSPGFGPRSPAVDALLVHSDVRTKWTSDVTRSLIHTLTHPWGNHRDQKRPRPAAASRSLSPC